MSDAPPGDSCGVSDARIVLDGSVAYVLDSSVVRCWMVV